MLALARERAPSGTFLEHDLTTLELPDASFDAVVSLYVFGHVPAAEHRSTYGRVASWLRAGGVFIANFPLTPGDDVEADWLGVPMFFGGIGREATEQGLREPGSSWSSGGAREPRPGRRDRGVPVGDRATPVTGQPTLSDGIVWLTPFTLADGGAIGDFNLDEDHRRWFDQPPVIPTPRHAATTARRWPCDGNEIFFF